MSTDYAEKNEYESSSPQGNRHQHVLRQVCRETPCAQGQCRNVHTGTLRTNRNTEIHDRIVGVRLALSGQRRISQSCESIRRFDRAITPKRVKNGKISENSEKIFFAKTLEKQGFQNNSEKILKIFPEFSESPIDNLAKVGYNGDITIGRCHPNQKRDSKRLSSFTIPDSKPEVTRFTASDNFSRSANSYKAVIATNALSGQERTTP